MTRAARLAWAEAAAWLAVFAAALAAALIQIHDTRWTPPR